MLRDNGVEAIDRDSIHQHIIFAVQRFASLYIVPSMSMIWENVLYPSIEMMWNVYDIVYWSYVNHLYPILSAMHDQIHSIYVNLILPVMNELYNYVNYLYEAANWMYIKNIQPVLCTIWDNICSVSEHIYTAIKDYAVPTIYDYVYGPICTQLSVMWNNILHSLQYISSHFYEFVSFAFTKIQNDIVNIMDSLIEFLQFWYPKMWQSVKLFAEWANEKMFQPMTQCFVDFKDICVDFLQPMYPKMANYLKHFLELIKGFWSKCMHPIVINIIDSVQSATMQFIDWLNQCIRFGPKLLLTLSM